MAQPVWLQTIPGLQVRQIGCPGERAVPAGHFTHVLPSDVLPAGHAAHDVLPGGEKVPPGHNSQKPPPEVTCECVPAGHSLQNHDR